MQEVTISNQILFWRSEPDQDPSSDVCVPQGIMGRVQALYDIENFNHLSAIAISADCSPSKGNRDTELFIAINAWFESLEHEKLPLGLRSNEWDKIDRMRKKKIEDLVIGFTASSSHAVMCKLLVLREMLSRNEGAESLEELLHSVCSDLSRLIPYKT